MSDTRSWSCREPQDELPALGVWFAVLAVLLGGTVLVQIHHSCLERAAGNPQAIERCENQR